MAIIPDIPPIGSTPNTLPSSADLIAQLKRRYSSVVHEKLNELAVNAKAYTNNRVSTKSNATALLRNIYKGTTFIPAHPSRFAVGGNDFEHTKYFILHRPGIDIPSARFDNLIREFVQPGREASTHFGVSQAGQIVQFVDLADTAWHTGAGSPYLNHVCVGVEMEGAVGEPVTDAMYQSVASLIARTYVLSGMPIDADHIVQHFKILPQTKSDAGTNVSVERLISLATNMTSQYSAKDLFRPEFSPNDVLEETVNNIFALAAVSPASQNDLVLVQSMSASMSAQVRAAQLSAMSRPDMSSSASSDATQEANQKAAVEAFIQSLAGLNAYSSPQTNVASLLYDPGVGTFNDSGERLPQ